MVVGYPWNKKLLTTEFTGLPPNVVLMDNMEEIKVVLQKETMKTRETLLIEIKNDFDQQRLGAAGLFDTQKVLMWIELLQKV